MDTSRKNLGFICLFWAFAILLGLSIGFNAPLVLLIIATALYLFS